MIRAVQIQNFRCFENVSIEKLGRLNVFVGDNGSGKTTALEALFLALSCQTENAIRVRQHRGFDAVFTGTSQSIEKALWGDLFFKQNMNRPIFISLSGSGVFTRSLSIGKGGSAETFIPFRDEIETQQRMAFTWTDSSGTRHQAVPLVTSEGLKLPTAFDQENISFYFPSSVFPSAQETATRFSELSQRNNHEEFVRLFKKEYSWIQDIGVEVFAGSPVLFASTRGDSTKVPLPSLSGGINRIISALLAIYASPGTVILIDELENGQYFRHFPGIWRLMLDFIDYSGAQVFVTSHSQECIEGLFKISAKRLKDISLHQFQRRDGKYSVDSFDAKQARLAIEYGEEIR